MNTGEEKIAGEWGNGCWLDGGQPPIRRALLDVNIQGLLLEDRRVAVHEMSKSSEILLIEEMNGNFRLFDRSPIS